MYTGDGRKGLGGHQLYTATWTNAERPAQYVPVYTVFHIDNNYI